MIDKLSNKADAPKERAVERAASPLPATLRGGRCPRCGGPLRDKVAGDPPVIEVWCTNCNYRTATDAKIHG
jgi:hypothetical protein